TCIMFSLASPETTPGIRTSPAFDSGERWSWAETAAGAWLVLSCLCRTHTSVWHWRFCLPSARGAFCVDAERIGAVCVRCVCTTLRAMSVACVLNVGPLLGRPQKEAPQDTW